MLKGQKRKILFSVVMVVLIILPSTVYIIIKEFEKNLNKIEESSFDNSVKGVDVATVPYITSLAPIRIKSGEEYIYVPYYFDADTALDNLTLSLISAPSWLSLSDGVVRGIVPDVVSGSSFKFVIEVFDGYNATTQINYFVVE